MRCPFCNQDNTRVVDSRPIEDSNAIRRRRMCDVCGRRFTTYEKVETIPLIVIKKDMNREQYDRSKIETGILRACHKRPVSAEKINEMVNDFSYRLQSQGMNLDLYLHYTGSDMKTFRATFQESAERQVKIRLALEKIAEVEQLTASEEDIQAEYEKIAQNYGIDVEKVKGILPAAEIAKDVTVNKAIDLVKESAEVTEKKVKKTAAKSKKKAEGEAAEEADEE